MQSTQVSKIMLELPGELFSTMTAPAWLITRPSCVSRCHSYSMNWRPHPRHQSIELASHNSHLPRSTELASHSRTGETTLLSEDSHSQQETGNLQLPPEPATGPTAHQIPVTGATRPTVEVLHPRITSRPAVLSTGSLRLRSR